MKDIEIVQTIDYILKELDYKYKDNFRLYIREDNHSYFTKKIFDNLYDRKCFDFRTESEDIYYEWEYRYTDTNEWIYNINTLILFDYKRKLLWKTQKSIINSTTLENIARFIWDSWNAQSIIEILEECNIPDYLIIYPNTKWRMVYDIFKVLSTSIYEEWHRLLFSVIETFLIPIRFSSIKAWIETQNHFSEYLAYDWYIIDKGKVKALWNKKDMYDVYYESKEGKRIEINEYEKIKDIISNTEYKKVTLLKWKDWNIDFIEWERHIDSSKTKFVELQNDFPYSDINSSIHNWKTSKYIVNEKIKLKKENN